MFIERMLIQCASFGTENACDLILLFFFGENLPSYACSMEIAQAISDNTSRSEIKFEPAQCGTSAEIEHYEPRVLFVTAFDNEHVGHRALLKVAMRELLEGKVDMETFASEHFGPAKAPLAAPALDIFISVFLDDGFSAHTEVKERIASHLQYLQESCPSITRCAAWQPH